MVLYVVLKFPLWGRPVSFFPHPFLQRPATFAELWLLHRIGHGSDREIHLFFISLEKWSSRRGNPVGTSACGEHGWGRGCDAVSPSETVVISPLMGEIVWECDCECGRFA